MTPQSPAPSGQERTDASLVRAGARGTFSRTITQSDISLYAGITGDFAPHHVNVEFGRSTRFGTTIAHGLFTASLMDGALAVLFPQGSVSVRRTLIFSAPVRPGDTVTAIVEVTRVDAVDWTATLATTCTNQRGEVVVTGTATERLNTRGA